MVSERLGKDQRSATHQANEHDANAAETIEKEGIDKIHKGSETVVDAVQEQRKRASYAKRFVQEDLIVVDDEDARTLGNELSAEA